MHSCRLHALAVPAWVDFSAPWSRHRLHSHHAAKAGSRDCIVALVRAGADINATEQRMRWTPLHVAAYNGKDVRRIGQGYCVFFWVGVERDVILSWRG